MAVKEWKCEEFGHVPGSNGKCIHCGKPVEPPTKAESTVEVGESD